MGKAKARAAPALEFSLVSLGLLPAPGRHLSLLFLACQCLGMGDTQLVSSHKATLEKKGAPFQGRETGGGEKFSLKALNAGDWAGLPYAKADKPTE